jgi:hypothetical protein
MSVFRAAAGEPAYRPPDAPHPAPPAHRVPHQRNPDHGCPDGPTEPLGAAGGNSGAFGPPRTDPGAFGPGRESSGAFGPPRTDPGAFGSGRENSGAFSAARENQGQFGPLRENAGPFGVTGENAGPFGPAREDPVPAGTARTGPDPAGAPRENRRAPESQPPGGGRPRRRFGVAVAVLFSLLALLASAAGGWFSWRALEVTRAFAPPQRLPSASDPARTRPPQPAQYPVAYAKEPLRLQVACAAVLHLDLDEPRADAAEVLADLRYDGGCGTRPPQLSLGVGAAGGSRRVSADADAADCDRAIRTGPLGRGLQVEVQQGTAVCVLTAATPAELVLVEIIDVGGSGTAGLRATSWRVPEDR